jgi:transcriptional regulator with XRE-family HTH domain
MTASDNGVNSAILPSQVRAARALLDWSREHLSAQAGVPLRTLDRMESGIGTPQRRTLAAIRAALEAAGVEFIAENGGGAGVRLRKGGAPHETPPEWPELRSVGPEDEDRAGPEAPTD